MDQTRAPMLVAQGRKENASTHSASPTTDHNLFSSFLPSFFSSHRPSSFPSLLSLTKKKKIPRQTDQGPFVASLSSTQSVIVVTIHINGPNRLLDNTKNYYSINSSLNFVNLLLHVFLNSFLCNQTQIISRSVKVTPTVLPMLFLSFLSRP